jgi:hypothetical protein
VLERIDAHLEVRPGSPLGDLQVISGSGNSASFWLALKAAREALSKTTPVETSGEEDATKLRRLLAFCYSSHRLYLDDGEMQDNSVQPFIDWKRDSVDEIVRKIHERGLAQIMRSVETTAPPQQKARGDE